MSADTPSPDVEWPSIERRKTGPLTLRELEEHIDERIRRRLVEHAQEESRESARRFDELKALLTSAFPGGDPEEHRRYHDEVMKWMHERREMWRAVREKTLTALLWGALVAMGSAAWHYIKTKLGAP